MYNIGGYMSKIFFVSGKSCSGKDTIFNILKQSEELNLKTVVGHTTRPMRVGEQDGVEYFFVDEEKLNEAVIKKMSEDFADNLAREMRNKDVEKIVDE